MMENRLMLKRLLNFFRLTYKYDNPISQRQAVALMLITTFIGVLSGVWLVIYVLMQPRDLQPLAFFALLGSPIISGIVFLLIKFGRLNRAAWVFTAFLTVATGAALTIGLDDSIAATPIVALAAAGLLLGRRGILVFAPIILLFTLNAALIISQETQRELVARADGLSLTLGVAITVYLQTALILYGFGGNIERVITKATQQVSSTGDISRFTQHHRGIYSPRAIYTDAVEMLRGSMGYAFAQVYIPDDGGRLTQRLRTGVVAAAEYENMMVEAHVNDANALQNAVRLREIVVVSRNEREIRRSHLMPTATYGIAVPVVDGENVLAVLDIQSTDTHVDDSELLLLEALASQISALIVNGRRITSLQNDLTEQTALIDSLRRQLRVARESQSLETNEWSAYLAGRRTGAIGFDLRSEDGEAVAAHDLPDEVREALESGEVAVTAEADGSYTLRVPVVLDETVIGAMAFSLQQEPDDQRVAMAGTVAQRLAVALENKRLYEQSKALAIRERKASDAANLLISATDVDAVLNLAADSFNRTLGAVRTHIQLNPEAVRTDKAVSLTADSTATPDDKGDRS